MRMIEGKLEQGVAGEKKAAKPCIYVPVALSEL